MHLHLRWLSICLIQLPILIVLGLFSVDLFLPLCFLVREVPLAFAVKLVWLSSPTNAKGSSLDRKHRKGVLFEPKTTR